MDSRLQKQIRDRLEELPGDVRRAIEAADLDKRIQTIGNKHHLHIDQVGKLEDETLLVMLAFTDPSEFASQIQNQVGISQTDAENIATEISNEIFMPIRKSMQEFIEQQSLLKTLTEESKTVHGPSVPQRAPKPVSTPPPPPKPAPPPTPTSKPQVPLAPHPHDLMLVEKTVTTPATPTKPPVPSAPAGQTPKPEPPKPQGYKTDPYREPPEL